MTDITLLLQFYFLHQESQRQKVSTCFCTITVKIGTLKCSNIKLGFLEEHTTKMTN
jgi:hypothetical protein